MNHIADSDRRVPRIDADYISLSRMTLSEATDHEYMMSLSGYQLKLFLWGLFYLQVKQTGVPQLDFPKSTWEKMRQEVIEQIDRQGESVDPTPISDNHLDVMSQLLDIDDDCE